MGMFKGKDELSLAAKCGVSAINSKGTLERKKVAENKILVELKAEASWRFDRFSSVESGKLSDNSARKSFEIKRYPW